MKAQKNLFIERLKREISTGLQDPDRRRRSEARLNGELLEMVGGALPSVVEYNETSKGLIKWDFIEKNLSSKKTRVLLLGTNTPGNGEKPSQYYVVISNKRNLKGCYKIKSTEKVERLTMERLEELINKGVAKPFNKLNEALGL